MLDQISPAFTGDVEPDPAHDPQEGAPAAIVAVGATGNRGFELPASVWIGMVSCYTVFLGSLLVATGGSGHARFAIVISAIYTAIYFGVARIGARQAGAELPSPLVRRQPLQTWTGPMDKASVYGQVLIVPAAIAAFGLAMLIIIALAS